jgi:hypothetical protein
MIKLAIPFLLSDPKQIPDIVKVKKYYLEGIVFDATLFKKNVFWKKVEESILYVSLKFPNQLYSLHFPVDNADYLNSSEIKDYLYRFIDLAIKNNIKALILHSNYIRLLSEFNLAELVEKRNEYLHFLNQLNKYVMNKKIKICIENMPIVGICGNDVDPIFVLPEDFSKFNFDNIKVVWDIGHWGYTWSVLKSLNGISPYINASNLKFTNFFKLKKILAHLHFSSFKTISLPGTRNTCLDGITPAKGDIDDDMLTNTLFTINSWKQKLVMSLEIKDKNYANRVNLIETIKWINKKIFLDK